MTDEEHRLQRIIIDTRYHIKRAEAFLQYGRPASAKVHLEFALDRLEKAEAREEQRKREEAA